MKLSLRHRILLTLLPWLALLAGVGGGAMVLLHQLGGSIDGILRENYASVIYMERLKEALERIDSSFTLVLAGQDKKEAKKAYDQQWLPYMDNLREEQKNVTIPGEGDLVQQLTELTKIYRQQGDAFFDKQLAEQNKDYFVAGGLADLFRQIKDLADRILRLNQENMEQAARDARLTSQRSILGLWIGLAVAAALSFALAWRTVQAILRPIRAMTESAQAIGGGNLDQLVSVVSEDELGKLAAAFNVMARQLREFRQSQKARILRIQQTSQATVNAFPHPVLVVDHEGQVTIANPAARRMLGVLPQTKESLATVPWQPPEPLRQPLAQALREQRDYLPAGFDQTITLRAEGEEHTFLPRILAIRDADGHILGAAVLLEDVTRFRLLDQVKSNLVATVSHELKTPLTGIRLAVHLLLEESVGPLSSKQMELLLDARDNAERLLGMIDNLLDLARLEGGVKRLELRPEQPADLLRQAAEAMRHRAEDKNIELTVAPLDGLPDVAVDPEQIGRALYNLLDNALRYTNPGGKIRLTASAAQGAVVLEVADTGQGIPPAFLPHVFERFFRVPGQTQDGGTGLGLAIVREIAQAHGGAVTCESRLGQGTRFTLTLPIWRTP
ncbi:MAG TPA: ATP-binding protein [Gemmataceae bacterium]|nr:ATP-binding protein [Gemmataceae bacterium]